MHLSRELRWQIPVLATADPTDMKMLADLESLLNERVKPVPALTPNIYSSPSIISMAAKQVPANCREYQEFIRKP